MAPGKEGGTWVKLWHAMGANMTAFQKDPVFRFRVHGLVFGVCTLQCYIFAAEGPSGMGAAGSKKASQQ